MFNATIFGSILVALWFVACGAPPSEHTGATPSRGDASAPSSQNDVGNATPNGEGRTDAGTLPENTSDLDEEPEGFVPAAPGMYRLTADQYRNTIRDLFGDKIQVTTPLEVDTPIHGFASIGSGEISISPQAVEQYEVAAESIAAQLVNRESLRMQWFDCQGGQIEPFCLEDGLRALGLRVWRRPLTDGEVRDFVELHGVLAERFTEPFLPLKFVITALFQSPYFLFRIEAGEEDPNAPGQRRFTNYEMASRISFLVWNSAPDEALLEAAARGDLVESAGVNTAVERMFEDDRAKTAMLRFFSEYLSLSKLDELQKNREVFPLMSETLGASMRQEMEAMIEGILFDDGGRDVHELLTTKETRLNDELASIYQVSIDGDWSTFRFDDNHPRAGLLTTAGFLAMNAHNTVTSPTFRGKYIQNKLFCFDVPPPPPGVAVELEPQEGDGPLTTRERLAQHRDDPACYGCHQLMDPMGLAFENFDALGMWRTQEHGLPIDASVELGGQRHIGGRAVGEYIAEQERFGDCVTIQFFRHAMGHLETEGEGIELTRLQDAFASDEYHFKELFLTFVNSEVFRRPGAVQ